MKNRIVDFFPHSTIAESNIFYYNKNSRTGRIYNESGFTDYYAWIPNEGLPPFIDSDNDGTIDIRELGFYSLQTLNFSNSSDLSSGQGSFDRPDYNGTAPTSVSIDSNIRFSEIPPLFNNTGVDLSFVSEFDCEVIGLDGSRSILSKGSVITLKDGDSLINIPTDSDEDGMPDFLDLYPNNPNRVSGTDTDSDGIDDEFDTDKDGDGVANQDDSYPDDSNRASGNDSDGDGTDDEFDTDDDNDGVLDVNDNYPLNPNRASGNDSDGDGTDDEFDSDNTDGPLADKDGDGVANQDDNYPDDSNRASGNDSDGDGTDDEFDSDNTDGPLADKDGDGVANQDDNYPDDSNRASGNDSDGDGTDDEFDSDNTDGPLADKDGDGVANQDDSYPDDSNRASGNDSDGDGTDDEFDSDNTDGPLADKDGDGVANQDDSYPDDSNRASGNDSDGDGTDDEFDSDNTDGPLADKDGDGVANQDDSYPDDSNRASGNDSDGDGTDDEFDSDNTDGPLADKDGDGVANQDDSYPDDSNRASGNDSDGDGTDDEFDSDNTDGPLADKDGDGVANQDDSYPDDSNRASGNDSDGDGTDDEFDSDNTDGPLGDKDGDGVANQDDSYPDDSNRASGTDTDGDGIDDEFDPVAKDSFLGISPLIIQDTPYSDFNQEYNHVGGRLPDWPSLSNLSHTGGQLGWLGYSYPTGGWPVYQGVQNQNVYIVKLGSTVWRIGYRGTSKWSNTDGTVTEHPIDHTLPTLGVSGGTENEEFQEAAARSGWLYNNPGGSPSLVTDIPITATLLSDKDGDGILDQDDLYPDDPTKTGLDKDLDGIDDAVDDDRDNDGYDDDVDVDPDNPYVFTGDSDNDGVDSTIDPDDTDPNVGVYTSTTSDPKLYYDYKYIRGSSLQTYSSYYRKNVVGTIPPEAQGCLMARIGTTTSANSGYATAYQYLTPRSTAYPSTYTTQGGHTGSRDDYDPYPTITGIPVETFFRVNIPKGSNHWNTLYSQEWNILPIPYFLNDGTIFAIPFEWKGYYPLYTTQAEAEARSPSGSAHSHTFGWDSGTHNSTSGLNWPYWKQETRNVTRTFWMPNGLTPATGTTPDRQYLTHHWHGNHPGLPVWSAVYPAGAENGASGYMSKNNGKAFEWIGPQSGNNLAVNTATYNGVYADLLFPPAIKSESLTAIKEAIPVSVS